MSFFKFNWLFASILVLFVQTLFSQTLIINEVSNGASGNQEYVEFVVVSETATYDCTSSSPPCLDIRGWIFDDNSGYHGTGGVAAGAVRFSQDPLWSCIPLGTIILLYNNVDPNTSIPPTDLSLADGNCSIVAPINNAALFEANVATPGAAACSYPIIGWTIGGNWTNTLLANSGDCARIVNLLGCEVFSLCWASDNQNNLIYFSSGGSGTDNVWLFNGGDPTLQNNWTEGCADPTSCGSNNQTPGLPNNSANAAYIAQFNNGCSPISPLTVSLTSTDPTCGCNGAISATASGSIGGYTYEWLDASMNPIGQSSAAANNLCAGNYFVTVTSSINCSVTLPVTLSNNISSITPIFDPISPICQGEILYLPLISTNGISGSWSSNTNNASAATYTFTPTTNATTTCATTATMTVTICPPTTPTFTQLGPFCENVVASNFPATSNNGISGTWNTSISTSTVGSTTYTFTPTTSAAPSCPTTATMTIIVHDIPTISAGTDQIICEGQNVILNASGGVSYIWSSGHQNGDTIYPSINQTYTVTGTSIYGCTSADQIMISVQANPTISFEISPYNVCLPQTIQLINTSTNASNCLWSLSNGQTFNGYDGPTLFIDEAGCIDIELSASFQGCQSVFTMPNAICVNESPIANFTASSNEINELEPTINFENQSINSTFYFWSFGDEENSSETNPEHTYANFDINDGYYVNLVAESEYGCFDTASCFIKIIDELIFYVPNTFTPDENEFNQEFKPIFTSGFDPEDFTLLIFNRWGEQIFESHNAKVGWNGCISTKSISTSLAQDGTYIWKIIFKKSSSNKRKEIIGHVNLLR